MHFILRDVLFGLVINACSMLYYIIWDYSVGMDCLLGYHQFAGEVQKDTGVHPNPMSVHKDTSSD